MAVGACAPRLGARCAAVELHVLVAGGARFDELEARASARSPRLPRPPVHPCARASPPSARRPRGGGAPARRRPPRASAPGWRRECRRSGAPCVPTTSPPAPCGESGRSGSRCRRRVPRLFEYRTVAKFARRWPTRQHHTGSRRARQPGTRAQPAACAVRARARRRLRRRREAPSRSRWTRGCCATRSPTAAPLIDLKVEGADAARCSSRTAAPPRPRRDRPPRPAARFASTRRSRPTVALELDGRRGGAGRQGGRRPRAGDARAEHRGAADCDPRRRSCTTSPAMEIDDTIRSPRSPRPRASCCSTTSRRP